MSAEFDLEGFNKRVQTLTGLSAKEKLEVIQLASIGKLNAIVSVHEGFPMDKLGNTNLTSCLNFRVNQYKSKFKTQSFFNS
jgi:hypothetical protein